MGEDLYNCDATALYPWAQPEGGEGAGEGREESDRAVAGGKECKGASERGEESGRATEGVDDDVRLIDSV